MTPLVTVPPPKQENLRFLGRFFDSLTLLKRTLPVSLTLIALACCTPQLFLWYIGLYVRCHHEAGAVCSARVLGHFDVPLAVGGLFAIAGMGIFLRIVSWMAFELTGQWSTTTLHDRMIGALVRARTTYFDETPSGHLASRILSDFGNLRMMGIIRVGDALNATIEVLASAALIVIVNPWPALAIVPVVAALYAVMLAIAPMLGHMQEITAAWRGEVLHRTTDMIDGRGIFSLYGKEAELLRRLHRAFEKLADAQLLSVRITAWARLWQRLLSNGYGFVVLLFVTAALADGRISIAYAAMIVSAIMALSGTFGWLCWCLMSVTETLGNARRVFELVDLPREAATEGRVPAHGEQTEPLSGDIVFKAYRMSYRAGGEEVLKGLDLMLPAGARIGIVGRTGAGKSSLVQALFRMVHVTGGDITIGSESIFTRDVRALRRQFGVVPQDPYLFSGTIKENLDRGGRLPDAALADALRTVGLETPLATKVDEGGRNLSVGQRQLLCLARILLADKRYIFMDEPTSAVDQETDARIQQVLATALVGRTVVTIAHRLETLRHYDRIVELGNGRLVREGPAAAFFS